MQRFQVTLILCFLVCVINLQGCSSCERYVQADQTLNVKGITTEIGKVKNTTGDITFNNTHPVVPDSSIESDRVQYALCKAIESLNDGPEKDKKKMQRVDLLFKITEDTAKLNSGNIKVESKPSVKSEVKTAGESKTDIVRIDQPVVNKPQMEYGHITFRTGDVVRFEAGGCVQTGGSGKTWKRYVNPTPDNLYYGTVTVPGVISTQRLKDVINKPFTIPASSNDPKLSLGYVDDNYNDNGYWGHDDGTGDQCKNVGEAFVVVTIERN